MQRLGLEYVDLYLMDWPAEANGKYIDAWGGGIMRARQDGLIKSIGVANFTAEKNLSDIIDLSYFPPVVNLVELHPLLNQSELRGVHAGHSIITGASIPLTESKLLELPAVAEIAAAHGKSAAQVLIRWSLQQGDIVIPPRGTDPAQIAANADVFDFDLTPEQIESLGGLDDGTRFVPNPQPRPPRRRYPCGSGVQQPVVRAEQLAVHLLLRDAAGGQLCAHRLHETVVAAQVDLGAVGDLDTVEVHQSLVDPGVVTVDALGIPEIQAAVGQDVDQFAVPLAQRVRLLAAVGVQNLHRRRVVMCDKVFQN